MTPAYSLNESISAVRLELERMAFAAAGAQEELNVFFEILNVLSGFETEEVVVAKLLEVFQRTLKFEKAFVVMSEGPTAPLATIFSTAPQFTGATFPFSPSFQRLQSDGVPVIYFDVAEGEEWRAQPESVRNGLTSALYLFVKDHGRGMALICTHSARGFFGRRDLNKSRKFAVFLSQALSSLTYTNHLRQLNDSLKYEMDKRTEAEKLLAKHQSQILHSAKMAALGEMAGGIAHEVNNPLGIIQNAVEQLKELVDRPEIDRESVSRLVAIAIRTVTRISKIVESLRAFSRDDTSDPFQNMSVRSMIEAVLALSGTRLRENQIELILNLPDESLMIACHPTQIEQAILNLLVNARDAILNEKKKWIRISVESDSEFVTILITDSGPGIPEFIRSKLFQPFFTTKAIGKGTGLGLGVSKGLVELHCGSLELDTASANTCFKIKLPRGLQVSDVLRH